MRMLPLRDPLQHALGHIAHALGVALGKQRNELFSAITGDEIVWTQQTTGEGLRE